MRICTIIPARMGSTRLPNKPLADIGGKPMIVHVLERVKEAGVGDVFVACDAPEIAEAVRAFGGQAVMTPSDCPSGSDRIWAAMQALLKEGYAKPDVIINAQGDEPLLPAELLHEAAEAFELGWPDVVTFAHVTEDPADIADSSKVKVVTDDHGRALYFSRCPIPHGATAVKRHIGLYAYRFEALEAFVSTPPAALEQQEKLEQLRGLEMGLKYYVGLTAHEPVGVDTAEDLARVRRLMGV